MIGTIVALPDVEETRERILVATLTVIGEVGVDRLTHRRVAEAAGVALGSTTRYSRDRMDLVRQAAGFYIEWSEAQTRRFWGLGPPADVDELVDRLMEFLQPTELLAAEYELLVLAHRDRQLSEMVTTAVATIDAPMAAHLADIGVADPTAGARLIRAVVRGSAVEYLSEVTARDELATRLTHVIESMPRH